MKTAIKRRLSRLGLPPYLDFGRRLPEIMCWMGNGCSGIAPAPVKRLVVTTQYKSGELQAILDSPIKTHVNLIDDARCFDGSNCYPYFNSLAKEARDNGIYAIGVSADIIRLIPKAKA